MANKKGFKIKGKHNNKKGYRKVVKSTEKRKKILTYEQFVEKTFEELWKIMDIWAKQHNGHGFFIRHIDGNRANNAIYNIAYLHASDVFAHINDGWVVDWECDLTPKQEKRRFREAIEFEIG